MALARAHADERLVRITMCAYRKKGISEKEFHHYWAEVHGPLAREWFHRCGIVKYVQYHSSPAQRELARGMMSKPGKHQNLDYDALIDVYVRDFQDFVNAFEDPLYLTQIRPDEDKFCDTASMILMVGTDHAMIYDGEKVESHVGETWWRE